MTVDKDRLVEGVRVKLTHLDDEPPGFHEVGVIEARDEMVWGTSWVVRIDEEYRLDPADRDGIREVNDLESFEEILE